MDKAVKTGDELMDLFFRFGRFDGARGDAKLGEGVFVGAGVRRDILTSIEQGRIVIEGRVLKIEFENLTGGVYRAFVTV